MMGKLKIGYKGRGGVVMLLGAIATNAANAIPFGLSAVSLSYDSVSGYGIDADENKDLATLLDVRFDTSVFSAPASFQLDSVNATETFLFATVDFQEPNSNSGIVAAETDNLNLQALFTFTTPFASNVSFLASGIANTGSISDAAVDYGLDWNPMEIIFGSGGKFLFELQDLSFTGVGSQNLFATITLLSLPEDQIALSVANIPEPTTLVLFALGLAGLGIGQRRLSTNI